MGVNLFQLSILSFSVFPWSLTETGVHEIYESSQHPWATAHLCTPGLQLISETMSCGLFLHPWATAHPFIPGLQLISESMSCGSFLHPWASESKCLLSNKLVESEFC